MQRADAISQMRELTLEIGARVTKLHPLMPGLDDKPTQDEIFKALYELTKNVETVKKQLLRLERRDESSDL
jgi:hypothetical protein